ncbi:MAG TPA: DUF1214 domain-containing protein [Burkholderiales bacterium]|nr:DUF1214 domain-containing protein [Burkholderiales bacterium]
MKHALTPVAISIVATVLAVAPVQAAQPAPFSDRDIIQAYHYLLGRLLVIRQEHLDLKEGFKWNQFVHRAPGAISRAGLDPGIAYSEAWVAVDEKSCTIVTLPVIKGRYYTVQLLSGWGETVANISERTRPKHPAGGYAMCLKGADVHLPRDARRIDLPGRKSRVVARVELGADPAEAVRLQKQITMKPTGSPRAEPPVAITVFFNDQLPRVEAFNRVDALLASEPDSSPGMGPLQARARAIAKAARNVEELKRIDDVIVKRAIPQFMAGLQQIGKTRNGWHRPARTGDYGSDYLSRSMASFVDIRANTSREAVHYTTETDGKGQKLEGSNVYTMTFPKGQPQALARYFWSVVAVDPVAFTVMDNPLKRYLLSNQSALQPNPDGSVTLFFAAKQPVGAPPQNWLPTPAGKPYNLTFRFYGPGDKVISGGYFPPPLVKTI